MRKLLVAIHDVSPRFEPEIDLLLERLARHVPVNRLAMLVVPDHWGENPIVPGSHFAHRLRNWSDQGVSMFAHGWFHKDLTDHRNPLARLKARHMTAGEGEFLGLDAPTAALRMAAARDLLEQIIERPALGFIAPAWLYGAGTMDALSASSFPLSEDHMKIWQPRTGRVLARGPVITWASRSRSRIISSLFAAQVLPPLLRFIPVVRVAVHPGDAHVASLLISIDDTLRRLRQTHEPGRYSDLLGDEEAVIAHPNLPAQL